MRLAPVVHPFLLLLLSWIASPSPALAHRLDEYLQATIVSIEPGEIRLKINLTPGVEVADHVLERIDRNQDGAISANEAAAYCESLKHDLLVKLDQRKMGLRLTASKFAAADELRTGWGIIQLELSVVVGPLVPGRHSFTLQNRHLPKWSVYLFNAAQPASSSVHILEQKRNQTQSSCEIQFTLDEKKGEAGVNQPRPMVSGSNRKSDSGLLD